MKQLFAYIRISTVKSMCIQSSCYQTSFLKIQILHNFPLKTTSRRIALFWNRVDDPIRDFNLVNTLYQSLQIRIRELKWKSCRFVKSIFIVNCSTVLRIKLSNQAGGFHGLILLLNVWVWFKCHVLNVIVVVRALFDKFNDFLRSVQVSFLDTINRLLRFLV